MKIIGSSFKNEYVRCFYCCKNFVWLTVVEFDLNKYFAVCAACRKKRKSFNESVKDFEETSRKIDEKLRDVIKVLR